MGFVLTEDQEMIRKSARAFVQQHYPIGHLRRLRDEKNPLMYSRELWKEFCATGLPHVAKSEEFGGSGLGMAEFGLVMEELGRSLAPTPILSTLHMLKATENVDAFACDEGSGYSHHPKETSVRFEGADAIVNGEKSFVIDGFGAETYWVVARKCLVRVPASTQGVSVERLSTVDSRNAARVRFENVCVRGAGASHDYPLDWHLDRATAALTAEMLGGIQQVYEITLAYLKVRKQFGVVIGSFQSLKHRMAQMFCEIELSKSIVYDALRAIDEKRPDASLLVSAAKARCNDTFLQVAGEAIQMHGGIGATDELDVGLYYKRARVAAMLFGDSAYHRDRFAKLSGY